jgi:chaperonin cofactor prefoldin
MPDKRGELYTVSELETLIEDAQWVLDNPDDYDPMTLASASRSLSLYRTLRKYARRIQELETELNNWQATAGVEEANADRWRVEAEDLARSLQEQVNTLKYRVDSHERAINYLRSRVK